VVDVAVAVVVPLDVLKPEAVVVIPPVPVALVTVVAVVVETVPPKPPVPVELLLPHAMTSASADSESADVVERRKDFEVAMGTLVARAWS